MMGLAAVFMIAAPSGRVFAQQQTLDVTAGLIASFDDNVLKYSSAQIADLESGDNPYRYGIARPGDLVFEPSLALIWQLQRGERKRSVRLKGEGDLYRSNGVANFGAISATWRETFARGRRLSISYYLSPDYAGEG